MEKMVYIGPDMCFFFGDRTRSKEENAYYASVRVGAVTFTGVVKFHVAKSEKGPTECGMQIFIQGIDGPAATVEALQRATNSLVVNQKVAGEIACQAFLNGFLDS